MENYTLAQQRWRIWGMIFILIGIFNIVLAIWNGVTGSDAMFFVIVMVIAFIMGSVFLYFSTQGGLAGEYHEISKSVSSIGRNQIDVPHPTCPKCKRGLLLPFSKPNVVFSSWKCSDPECRHELNCDDPN
ncbi:MAG: hypothetical protein ACTSUE_20135 [Promethearchaeota archaeon]